jgi:hypothetical protein
LLFPVPTLLTISKINNRHSNIIMKLTLIATAFAALLSTGYAAETNDRNLDAVQNAGGESPAMETQGMEPVLDEGKRTLGAEDDAAAAKAPKMTNEEGKAGGKKRALGNKKDYSGQSCSLCCDDDYHC